MKPFFEDGDRVQLYQGNCLEVMPQLEGKFDMVLSDPPYEVSGLSWDQVIPFEEMWENYKRLIKPNGAIVLFGSQPFTSALIMSNPKWFRYCWYWGKNTATGMAFAKYQPMRCIEEIAVFSRNPCLFYKIPIKARSKVLSKAMARTRSKTAKSSHVSLDLSKADFRGKEIVNPVNYLEFNSVPTAHIQHPTQKPIDLLSYLIKTYTLPGERILDNTAGSFSTGVAAILNGRKFVGIEREEKYCRIGEKRIRDALTEVDSMLIKPWEIDRRPIAQPQQMDLLEEPA